MKSRNQVVGLTIVALGLFLLAIAVADCTAFAELPTPTATVAPTNTPVPSTPTATPTGEPTATETPFRVTQEWLQERISGQSVQNIGPIETDITAECNGIPVSFGGGTFRVTFENYSLTIVKLGSEFRYEGIGSDPEKNVGNIDVGEVFYISTKQGTNIAFVNCGGGKLVLVSTLLTPPGLKG